MPARLRGSALPRTGLAGLRRLHGGRGGCCGQGGGLVQRPGLFTGLPQQSPAALLGTHKFSAVIGAATGCWRYPRKVRFPWTPVLLAEATALVCSFFGATAVSLLPRDRVRPLLLGLRVAMLAYTRFKKDFGALHRPRTLGQADLAIALAMGAAIGFYDGLFGRGTGSFLFIRFFGLDLLRASAASKVVSLATNLAALSFFLPAGHVLLAFAVPMAAANMLGAVIGRRLALRGGTPVIRKLFVALMVLIAKMGWDTCAGG